MSEVRKTDIVAGLRSLGLEAGSGVMVHSSLSSFGHVEGWARTVIEAIQEVLTPAGTLLMPSFCHQRPYHEGGPGYFDPTSTPTASGAIPDAFWRMPDVRRSVQPTHAYAAWGSNADRYTRWHHRTLTMGPESPLGLLHADGGFGLLIGVDYHVNTFHHVVEMSTGAPCLGLRTEAYPIRLSDGRMVMGRTWGWRGGECPLNDTARYQPLMQPYQREVRIGASRVILFRLGDCWEVVSRMLREGADGFPPCSRCPIRPRVCKQTVPSDWDAATGTLLGDSVAWTY